MYLRGCILSVPQLKVQISPVILGTSTKFVDIGTMIAQYQTSHLTIISYYLRTAASSVGLSTAGEADGKETIPLHQLSLYEMIEFDNLHMTSPQCIDGKTTTTRELSRPTNLNRGLEDATQGVVEK